VLEETGNQRVRRPVVRRDLGGNYVDHVADAIQLLQFRETELETKPNLERHDQMM
jgi:hypothetical protein